MFSLRPKKEEKVTVQRFFCQKTPSTDNFTKLERSRKIVVSDVPDLTNRVEEYSESYEPR